MIDHNLLINHMPDIKRAGYWISRRTGGAIDPQDASQDIVEMLMGDKRDIIAEKVKGAIINKSLMIIRKQARRFNAVHMTPYIDHKCYMDETNIIAKEFIHQLGKNEQIALICTMLGDTARMRKKVNLRMNRIRPKLQSAALAYGIG